MSYCNTGDLSHYIANDFFNVSWDAKLYHLWYIAYGLSNIHKKSIIHRDLHSGNILINEDKNLSIFGSIKIGDLGLSKSATEADVNETYGIIPYMAPEVLQGQKYTTASDIYSFGMIMWEYMTGRRPFWDRAHDTELIIDICDGLRPSIGDIVAPEGYIELMKECWDPDPNKRPISRNIYNTLKLSSRNFLGVTLLLQNKEYLFIQRNALICPVSFKKLSGNKSSRLFQSAE
ncbi:3572_t:CDS:2 [Funneliformis geosporum]|nr:3572_t:CDS:2 [Funneliformis geosporum]